MRTPEEISKIRECWYNQINQSEASRQLNIARCTVRDYYNRFSNGELLEYKPVSLLEILLLDQSKQEAYAYLLGLYLGDGLAQQLRLFDDCKPSERTYAKNL